MVTTTSSAGSGTATRTGSEQEDDADRMRQRQVEARDGSMHRSTGSVGADDQASVLELERKRALAAAGSIESTELGACGVHSDLFKYNFFDDDDSGCISVCELSTAVRALAGHART